MFGKAAVHELVDNLSVRAGQLGSVYTCSVLKKHGSCYATCRNQDSRGLAVWSYLGIHVLGKVGQLCLVGPLSVEFCSGSRVAPSSAQFRSVPVRQFRRAVLRPALECSILVGQSCSVCNTWYRRSTYWQF